MIDPAKKYRTRDGREVRIYATDGGNGETVHGAINNEGFWKSHAWDQSGFAFIGTGTSSSDLIEVRPRIQREVWLNVYPGRVGQYTFDSKEAADAHESEKRIACVLVNIDVEEGCGL